MTHQEEHRYKKRIATLLKENEQLKEAMGPDLPYEKDTRQRLSNLIRASNEMYTVMHLNGLLKAHPYIKNQMTNLDRQVTKISEIVDMYW